MSSQSIATIPNRLQLAELPDENIVRIFGFLDIKGLGGVASVCQLFAQLQEEGSLWCSLIPQACSFRLDLPAKERVRLSQISLGNPQEINQCILNFFDKTITQVDGGESVICPLAFQHPLIPNGSFVAYTYGTRQVSSAVIKSKDGVVTDVDGLFYPNQAENEFVLQLREHQEKPSQFHEFKLILKTNEYFEGYNNMVYENIERVAKFLKEIPQ